MTGNEIKHVVIACLAEIVAVDGATEGSRLKLDLGLDSLSLVAVIIKLEERLGIAFDDAALDPERLVTVANLMQLVAKHL